MAPEKFSTLSHNKIFTVLIGEIKPTHRCHISQIPSVDQTSRLRKEDIPAASSERAGFEGRPVLFPVVHPEPLLSLRC